MEAFLVTFVVLLLLLGLWFMSTIQDMHGRQEKHADWYDAVRKEVGSNTIIQGSGYALSVDGAGKRVAIIDRGGSGRWIPFSALAEVSAKRLYAEEFAHFKNTSLSAGRTLSELELRIRIYDDEFPFVCMTVQQDIESAEHAVAQLANAADSSAGPRSESVALQTFSVTPPRQAPRGWWQSTFG